jgi:hypothetical protein
LTTSASAVNEKTLTNLLMTSLTPFTMISLRPLPAWQRLTAHGSLPLFPQKPLVQPANTDHQRGRLIGG